jgi:hypothetical protein
MKKQSKSIKFLLNKLPELLINNYGYSKYYTWAQVYKTIELNSPDLLTIVKDAYALYCNKSDFDNLKNMININENYEDIRKRYEVPKDNEIPFFNKQNNDISIPNFGINPMVIGSGTGH